MSTKSRPITTLMLATSLDGCLVSQDSNELDPNPTWKHPPFIQSIIQQFFEFSYHPHLFNLTTGQAVRKLGINQPSFQPKKSPLQLAILDPKLEISPQGIRHLAESTTSLIYIAPKTKPTQKSSLPSLNNLTEIRYSSLNLKSILEKMYSECGAEYVTIQSAGSLNASWLEAGLIDFLSVIVYPLLVGNNGTPIVTSETVLGVQPLQFISSSVFDGNYLSLQYKVSQHHGLLV